MSIFPLNVSEHVCLSLSLSCIPLPLSLSPKTDLCSMLTSCITRQHKYCRNHVIKRQKIQIGNNFYLPNEDNIREVTGFCLMKRFRWNWRVIWLISLKSEKFRLKGKIKTKNLRRKRKWILGVYFTHFCVKCNWRICN